MRVSDLINKLSHETIVQIQTRLYFGESFYCDRGSEELKRNPIIMRQKVKSFCVSENFLIIEIDEDEDSFKNREEALHGLRLIDLLEKSDKDESVKIITMIGQDLPVFSTIIRDVETMIRIVKRNETLSNMIVKSIQKCAELEIYV